MIGEDPDESSGGSSARKKRQTRQVLMLSKMRNVVDTMAHADRHHVSFRRHGVPRMHDDGVIVHVCFRCEPFAAALRSVLYCMFL